MLRGEWRLALVLAAGCPRPMQATLQARPAVPAEVVFDSAWSLVARTHFDPTFRGLDWHAVRRALRPHAAVARDRTELRRVITRMLDTLAQSHFRLIPREEVDREASTALPGGNTGAPGFEIREIGGELVVVAVDVGSPAAAAGIEPGWAIDSADGRALVSVAAGAVSPRRRWRAVTSLLDGPEGSHVNLSARDAADGRHALRLVRVRKRGIPATAPNLPPRIVLFSAQTISTGEGGVVAVIRFDQWLLAIVPALDSAVDRGRGTCGTVIDLRGNGGGIATLVTGFAGHFVDSAVTLGTASTRDATMRFVATPRRSTADGRVVQPNRGPMAVLVDRLTASASEVFAGGLQAIGRARVIGDTTAGSVLPAVLDRLPNGDVLQHAIADYRTSAGVRLEGRGVVPDALVLPTRKDWARGGDPVMAQALAWISTARTTTNCRH